MAANEPDTPAPPTGPLQFTLRELLTWLTACAVLLALIRCLDIRSKPQFSLGFPLGVGLYAMVVGFYRRERFFIVFGAGVSFVCLVLIVWPWLAQ